MFSFSSICLPSIILNLANKPDPSLFEIRFLKVIYPVFGLEWLNSITLVAEITIQLIAILSNKIAIDCYWLSKIISDFKIFYSVRKCSKFLGFHICSCMSIITKKSYYQRVPSQFWWFIFLVRITYMIYLLLKWVVKYVIGFVYKISIPIK